MCFWVFMCVYVCMGVNVCVCVYGCLWVFICVCMCLLVFTSVCVSLCFVQAFIKVCVLKYVGEWHTPGAWRNDI